MLRRSIGRTARMVLAHRPRLLQTDARKRVISQIVRSGDVNIVKEFAENPATTVEDIDLACDTVGDALFVDACAGTIVGFFSGCITAGFGSMYGYDLAPLFFGGYVIGLIPGRNAFRETKKIKAVLLSKSIQLSGGASGSTFKERDKETKKP